MSLLRWIVPALLCLTLVACGPPKKSVFPPTVTVQQLTVLPAGQWRLTVRIQNNSYSGMDFSALEGSMQVAELVPIRLHASFKRDIPAITARISRDLFLADLESHEARINGPTPEDFDASLYAPAIWRSPHHVAAE